jgi:hypothetical protein
MVKMGTVWDRTVEFISDNLALLVPIAILTILVPTTITSSLEPLTGTPGFLVAVAILQLGLAIVTMWGQLAITALAIDPTTGSRAKRIATARLLPAIGVYVVVFAVALLAVVPILIMLMASGVDLANIAATSDASGAFSGPILLYALVLVIVGLFVGVRIAVATPVIIAERLGLRAIPRAFALTRGLTWKLIGVILLFGVVLLVATSATRLVVGSIFALTTDMGPGVSVGSVVTAAIVAAISTGFTVLATAFIANLYVVILRAREAAQPAPLASDPL